MNYTITPHEGRWLASDGIATAEGDEPQDALNNLTEPEPEACAIIAAGDLVGRECLTLVEAIALDVPDHRLRKQVQRIAEALECYLTLNQQPADEC